jgi:hypothetical protein
MARDKSWAGGSVIERSNRLSSDSFSLWEKGRMRVVGRCTLTSIQEGEDANAGSSEIYVADQSALAQLPDPSSP